MTLVRSRELKIDDTISLSGLLLTSVELYSSAFSHLDSSNK